MPKKLIHKAQSLDSTYPKSAKLSCPTRSLLVLSILMLVVALLLAGCSTYSPKEDHRLSIVVSSFPSYEWTLRVLGDRAADIDVELLSDKGIDPHSFQPSTNDFLKISKADLFIYGGGPSDLWAQDALKNAANKDMKTLSLIAELAGNVKLVGIDSLHAHDEEAVGGHGTSLSETAAQDSGSDGAHHAGDGHDDSNEIDEHVWMSLKNAGIYTRSIANIMIEIDPEHKEIYEENADAYIAELDTLDGEYANLIQNSAQKTVIIADRYPYRYLFDDYGLEAIAAFDGCSADFEASFETILALAKQLDEHHSNKIVVTDSSNQKIAKAVAENSTQTNIEIEVLDSMQSVKRADIDSGTTYMSIMRSNLEVLTDVLNGTNR